MNLFSKRIALIELLTRQLTKKFVDFSKNIIFSEIVQQFSIIIKQKIILRTNNRLLHIEYFDYYLRSVKIKNIQIIHKILMQFNRTELFNAIQLNTISSISTIITKLLKSIQQYADINDCSEYLMNLMQQLSKIMSSNDYTLDFKLKTTLVYNQTMQMIIFLISVDNPQIYIAFECTIFPIIVQKIQQNDQSFKNSMNFKNAAVAQRKELKKINQLIKRFYLETIIVLSYWIPKALDDSHNVSYFKQKYEELCKKGTKFPNENQLIFYTYEKLLQIQQAKIKILQQLNLQEKSISKQYHSQMLSSLKAIKNSSNRTHKSILENWTQSLMSKSYQQNLKEKRMSIQSLQSIKQGKSNIRSNSQKSKEEISFFVDKKANKLDLAVSQLQAQNAQLKKQIGNLKALIQQKDKFISKYRQQINRLTKMLNTQNIPFSFAEMNNTHEKSYSLGGNIYKKGQLKQLKQGLLKQITQPTQFKSASDLLKVGQFPFRVGQLKEKQRPSSFPIYFSLLTRQNKIRLKKSLIKDKQLLQKNSEIQIGIISKLKSDNEVYFCLVLTNVSNMDFGNLLFQWVFDKRSYVVQQINEIKPFILKGQQQQLQFVVKCIDSKYLDGILVRIAYISKNRTSEVRKLAFVIPMRPIKLMRQVIMSSVPLYQNSTKVQKVIKRNRKILSDFTKIKKYWNECIQQNSSYLKNTLLNYRVKFRYLSNSFYIRFAEMEQQKMLIEVTSHSDSLSKAETVLEQLVFVLQQK